VSRGRWFLQEGWAYAWALLAVPVIYGASFPTSRIAWLGWVAFIPWYFAVRRARTSIALLICCVSTLLGSYMCTPWLARAVANYYRQPLALGVLLFVGVWVVTISPFVIAFTLCFRQLGRRPSRWLPLLTGAAWAGAELGRARLFVGDPFGIFGYSQVGLTSLAQIADVTGVYGLSVLTMAFNAAWAELWLAYAARRRAPLDTPANTVAHAWQGVGLVLAILLAVLGYGFGRMRGFDNDQVAGTRIALVQGNLDLGSQWRQEFYGRNLEQYMRLTADALRTTHPQIVFWPESAMTFFLEDEPLYRAALGQLLSPSHTELVAGGARTVDPAQPRYFNAGFLIAPDGHIVAAYDKQRLLPFAEYFPFGGSSLLRRQFARVREFTPGRAARLLPTAAGLAGVVICNEVMFAELVTERVQAGAGYLVTLTNDSWLGDVKYAEEAFDMARMRAVEQHRYLVRASTSGPSAIVDPLGRVVTSTANGTRATTAGVIRSSNGLTLYARCGDAFGVLCAVLPIAVALLGRRRAARQADQSVASASPGKRAASGAA